MLECGKRLHLFHISTSVFTAIFTCLTNTWISIVLFYRVCLNRMDLVKRVIEVIIKAPIDKKIVIFLLGKEYLLHT